MAKKVNAPEAKTQLRTISARLGALVAGGMHQQVLPQPISLPNIQCNARCTPMVAKGCGPVGRFCSLVKGHDSQHICMSCRRWTISNRRGKAYPEVECDPKSETEFRKKHLRHTHEVCWACQIGIWAAARKMQTHVPTE